MQDNVDVDITYNDELFELYINIKKPIDHLNFSYRHSNCLVLDNRILSEIKNRIKFYLNVVLKNEVLLESDTKKYIENIVLYEYNFNDIIFINSIHFDSGYYQQSIISLLNKYPKYIDEVLDYFTNNPDYILNEQQFFDTSFVISLLEILNKYDKKNHFIEVFKIYKNKVRNYHRKILTINLLKLLFKEYIDYFDHFIDNLFEVFDNINLELLYKIIIENEKIDKNKKEDILIKLTKKCKKYGYKLKHFKYIFKSLESQKYKQLLIQVLFIMMSLEQKDIQLAYLFITDPEIVDEVINLQLLKLKTNIIK